MSSRRRFSIFLLIMTLLLTTACSISLNLTDTPEAIAATPTPFTNEFPETNIVPITPTTETEPAPATAEPACPPPQSGELLFTLDEAGNPFALCFLYPSDFTAGSTMIPDYYTITGTPYGEGEKLAGSMSLSFAPADGKTLDQYAFDTVAAQAPGMGLALTHVTLGDGIPGIRVDGIPGMVGTITLFLVHEDTAFILTFMPSDTIPEATADMLRLYAMVTSSWVFTR
jgi:hypothetical protein